MADKDERKNSEIAKWIADVKDELSYMREELQETQNDPNTNFLSEDIVEGSEYYIDMATTLKHSIDIIETGTLNELHEYLDKLEVAVNTYYEKREGLELTHEYDYVKNRLDTALTAKIILPNMLQYMKEMKEQYPELFSEKISTIFNEYDF